VVESQAVARLPFAGMFRNLCGIVSGIIFIALLIPAVLVVLAFMSVRAILGLQPNVD